jgi:hypothetical protein
VTCASRSYGSSAIDTTRFWGADPRRLLSGGAGAQIIYSAVADRQSVQHAGAVSPRFLLSLGYEHHDVRLRGLHGSGTSP